jgi:hypothetical protein
MPIHAQCGVSLPRIFTARLEENIAERVAH